MDGSAQGATAGVSVAIRDGICHSQLRREAFWGISHGAWTRPSTTNTRQPRPSDRQHLCPYGRYKRPRLGAGACGGGERPQGPEGDGERRRGGGDQERGWRGGSDVTLDADTEEDGWGQAPLMVSPWATQQSGERGLRVFKYKRWEEVPEEGLPVNRMGS